MKLNVAGVTFKNDDGTERQDILKVLYGLPAHITIAQLIETTYDGERAVKVIDEKSKMNIGWIKKTDLKNHPTLPEKMTATIDFYQDKFFAVLDEYQQPSQKLYHAVKDIWTEKKLSKPAVYEARVYRYILDQYK